MINKLKIGDLLQSKFDKRFHKVTKLTKTKVFYSDNEDGTGVVNSVSESVLIECFDFKIPKEEVLIFKEEKKPLFLVMQKVWFDEIESGNKDIEYRDDTDFYRSRLCKRDKNGKMIGFRNYKTIILQEGYNAGARRMIIELKKIVLDDIFKIHLGKILERQNFDRANAPKRKPSEKPRKPRQSKKKSLSIQEKLNNRRGKMSKRKI
ncbi:hypothetical protein [Soonwooa sp.]|uniref:hypothetical protein n=1 Tax=Soonwooa sp. TaxID=1938592 RepID=UPI0028A987C9|nr:hypothetical protein [Soonwooa sp.]